MANFTQHTINTPYVVGPVHCYSGVLGGELVLFDTGPPTEECREYLKDNVDLPSLKHVIITHCHVDHYGQAAWLEKEYGSKVYLPYLDGLKIRDHESQLDLMYELLVSLGFDKPYLTQLHTVFKSGALHPPFPKEFKIAEEDIPTTLGIEVMPCPGHSQSDLVYVVDKELAVTGDVLLRGIFQSPLLDVDVVRGGRFSNYEAYCATIVRLAGIKDKTVLPGHRKEISGVEETILFYVAKLLSRAKQLHPSIKEKNFIVLVDRLLEKNDEDIFYKFLKASELVFMKDFLQNPQLLRAALVKILLFDEVESLFKTAVEFDVEP